MDMARGYRSKGQSGWTGLNSDEILVIRLPDPRMLRVVSRSLLLALVLLTLPCIGTIWREFSSDSYGDDVGTFGFGSDQIDARFLDVIIQDLCNEGLIKKGDKALVVTSRIGAIIGDSRTLSANEVDLVVESDLARESSFPDETFDFAFSLRLEDMKSIDRIVKVGGIVVYQFGRSSPPLRQPNYRVVYLRRYDSTIMAMRKTSLVEQHKQVDSTAKRRLFEVEWGNKKAALEGLEDVLLEPPRKFLARPGKIQQGFNFLPELLDDSLEGYHRRVFVEVGSHEDKKGSAVEWFKENYPMRNQEFDFLSVENQPGAGLSGGTVSHIHASNWLIENVKEDDFVVMKAEAEVVEEMMESKTILLVDELFLECKNQWQNSYRKKTKRAYWECLALYGRLRDVGVAVHQWWE